MVSTRIHEEYSSIDEKDGPVENDKRELARLLRLSALKLFRDNPAIHQESQTVLTAATQGIIDRRDWKIGSQPIGRELTSVDVKWNEFDCDENMWGDFASFVVVYPPILDQDGKVVVIGLLKVKTLR